MLTLHKKIKKKKKYPQQKKKKKKKKIHSKSVKFYFYNVEVGQLPAVITLNLD